MYEPKSRTSKYLRRNQIELKGEIDKSTVTDEDFNTPLSILDESSRQEINKDICDLKSSITQLDLIDIYKILCQFLWLFRKGKMLKIVNISVVARDSEKGRDCFRTVKLFCMLLQWWICDTAFVKTHRLQNKEWSLM